MSWLMRLWAPIIALSLTVWVIDSFYRKLPANQIMISPKAIQADTSQQISELIQMYQKSSPKLSKPINEKMDDPDKATQKKVDPFRLPAAVEKKLKKKSFSVRVSPPPREYQLQGTVGSDVATIIGLHGESQILKPGDRIDSAKVIAIEPGMVTLQDRAGRFKIEMQR